MSRGLPLLALLAKIRQRLPALNHMTLGICGQKALQYTDEAKAQRAFVASITELYYQIGCSSEGVQHTEICLSSKYGDMSAEPFMDACHNALDIVSRCSIKRRINFRFPRDQYDLIEECDRPMIYLKDLLRSWVQPSEEIVQDEKYRSQHEYVPGKISFGHYKRWNDRSSENAWAILNFDVRYTL